MNTPWIARHGLTASQYQSEFDRLAGAGYRLIDINGYGVNDIALYAGIWEKANGAPWQARHGLTSMQYQTMFMDMVKQGYRPTRVCGYTVDGSDRYAAIFTKEPGPAVEARHGLTGQQYQQTFDDLVGKGYRLSDISGYTIDKTPRFAALFIKASGPAWQAKHNLTSEQFQMTFDEMVKKGYRLRRVSGYTVDDQPRFACIFENVGGRSWVARHNMTPAQYQIEFDDRLYQGYRLRDVTGYEAEGQSRYAAIWEADAMADADLALIDDKIKAYMMANGVPGLSLAISKSERLVYAEGFGLADKVMKENVGPKHRFRIASVSKPVTAIAIMDLVEKGKLSLDQKVFGAGAILGTMYGTKPVSADVKQITVRQLLQHTSGWSNDGGDPMFWSGSLTQAQIISKMLDDRPLKNAPGKVYEYLNFGYCVLGRIIEKVTGMAYETHVQHGVLKECGISQMEIGGASAVQRKSREVAYYGGSPYSLLPARMDAHGGWIATPIDLLRLMARTDGFLGKLDILEPSTEGAMYAPSSANAGYGAGWIVDSTYRGHNGAMDGTIAFLARRSDGFSFAVAANTRPSGDMFCFGLKAVLDEIVSKVGKWPDHDLF